MKIMNAIATADKLCNNIVDDTIKRRWLSELDGRIYFEIMHPNGEEGDFEGYSDDVHTDAELLVPYPYDALYITYLQKEIARHNSEMVRYENARILFNEQLGAFRKWWIRTNETTSSTIRLPVRRY